MFSYKTITYCLTQSDGAAGQDLEQLRVELSGLLAAAFPGVDINVVVTADPYGGIGLDPVPQSDVRLERDLDTIRDIADQCIGRAALPGG